MAKYLDYDGLSKLWSKIGDHFVKKTGNKSESITGDKKFTGTTTIGGTNIYSATAQVLGTNQNVTKFSGNKIVFQNGATFVGTALDAGLCTRGICGTDTGGTSKSELYLNYDGNNNYSRKVVLGAGSTGESLGTGCGYTYCAIRGDEMKKYVTSLGYTKNTGTVTSVSVKINGVVKGTVTGSGTIDLGTYLTSHQDISGKQDRIIAGTNILIEGNKVSAVIPQAGTTTRGGIKTGYYGSGAKLPVKMDGENAYVELTKNGLNNAGLNESYLSWGGQNFAGSYGPIDACMVPDLGANRFAFIPASAWKVEYSRDSGATWTDYGASDGQKLALTSEGTALSIGKADGNNKATSAYMLRLTLTTTGVVYSVLNKFLLYVSTSGSSGCYVTIQGRTKANLDAKNDTWVGFVSKVPISGWSGWNVINTNGITTHGNSAGHYAQLRFIFGCASSNTAYNGLQIQKLFAYGGVGWTVPSNMAKNGHMYKYDYNQNVKFPKKVYVNESKEVLATGQTNTFTGTQAFNSGKIYLGQGDSNSLDLGSDGRINTGNSTLVGFVSGTFTLGHSTYNTNIRGKASRPTYNGNDLALKSDIPDISGKANKSDIPTNYVTTNTDQTITGKKTFNAPANASGEQATAVFKTANGGQIIFGKEGPNSGSMIALDQVAGTRRLNFRASATPGAIVWSQPESNSSLYYDVTNVYFRDCTSVSFNSASTITFSKFANASALGTDSSGNLKKVSLAAVATSGSYNDLSNKPTIPDISGKADKSSLAKVATSGLYSDLSGVPTLSNVARTGSYNDLNNKPNAVTYSTSGSNHYLWAFGGRYKISAPGTLNSDGTYKDVTIITSENLSSQGLFVPMVGTGSTPMSGDIQIKGEYEGTNASSGPISGGSGQTHTSPRNADLSLGLKGISYHYYGNDNTYGGSSGLYTDGVCYKAKETSGGSYSKLDYLLDAGLTVFQYSGQSSANPALSNVKSTTITYDGKLTLREGTSKYTKAIKDLVETGDLDSYQKAIGSSTDVTMRTLSFKNGSSYSISGIYCTEISLTLGGSVGNEASASFSVSSSYQSSFTNGTWYFVACPTSGSWINTMCFGITDKSSTGGKLWVKRALSASQSTYKFTIIMVRLY